jgi:hypothetical protein
MNKEFASERTDHYQKNKEFAERTDHYQKNKEFASARTYH